MLFSVHLAHVGWHQLFDMLTPGNVQRALFLFLFFNNIYGFVGSQFPGQGLNPHPFALEGGFFSLKKNIIKLICF